jgi:hypothetical protein
MTLGELIEALKTMNPDAEVSHGFGKPRSYRGYYGDVAFEPKANVRVRDMLCHAESALGATFTGYKGGEYQMNSHTDCWISEYGYNSGDGISRQLVEYWRKETGGAQ